MARKASRTTPNFVSQAIRGVDFERAQPPVVLSEDVRDRRRGFTIVELLIVVVVIAILAAITIVAYNGITNRSKAAAASTAAEQAAKKVMTYAVTNSDNYPASLSDAGITDGSTTYQYRVDNSANPRTFCVTATTQNTSAYVSSTNATPTGGACAGHGVNGVAAITNFHPNPGAVTTGGVSNYAGTTGNVVSVGPVAASWSGSGSAYRVTWTNVSGNTGDGDIQVRLDTGWLQPDTKYTVVFRLRGPNRASLVGAPALYSTASAGNITTYDRSPTASQSLTANQVVDRWVTFQATSAGIAGGLRVVQSLSAKVVNDYMEISDIMVYEGDYDSAKTWKWGNSPGWIWNGTQNNSTSTGPAN